MPTYPKSTILGIAESMNKESSASLPAIERIEVSAETLNGFAHEEDFTALAFDLLREVTSHVCVAASLLPGDKKHGTGTKQSLVDF